MGTDIDTDTGTHISTNMHTCTHTCTCTHKTQTYRHTCTCTCCSLPKLVTWVSPERGERLKRNLGKMTQLAIEPPNDRHPLKSQTLGGLENDPTYNSHLPDGCSSSPAFPKSVFYIAGVCSTSPLLPNSFLDLPGVGSSRLLVTSQVFVLSFQCLLFMLPPPPFLLMSALNLPHAHSSTSPMFDFLSVMSGLQLAGICFSSHQRFLFQPVQGHPQVVEGRGRARDRPRQDEALLRLPPRPSRQHLPDGDRRESAGGITDQSLLCFLQGSKPS